MEDELEGRQDQIDNSTKEPSHKCIQDRRITRNEKRTDRLEKRQDETIKDTNVKLNLIWTAITNGDSRNTLYTITMGAACITSLAAVFIAFMAFFK
ncbi:hypothetical protein DSECCO2_473110 [anaerobic digester metagenome]